MRLSVPLPGPCSEEPNRTAGSDFHHSDFPRWNLPYSDPNATPNSTPRIYSRNSLKLGATLRHMNKTSLFFHLLFLRQEVLVAGRSGETAPEDKGPEEKQGDGMIGFVELRMYVKDRPLSKCLTAFQGRALCLVLGHHCWSGPARAWSPQERHGSCLLVSCLRAYAYTISSLMLYYQLLPF